MVHEQGADIRRALVIHIKTANLTRPTQSTELLTYKSTDLPSLAPIALEQPRNELDVLPSIDQDRDRDRRDRIVCVYPSGRRCRHGRLLPQPISPAPHQVQAGFLDLQQ